MVRMVPDLSDEAMETLAEAPDHDGGTRHRVICRRSVARERLTWFTEAAAFFPLIRGEEHKAHVCRRALKAIEAALR